MANQLNFAKRAYQINQAYGCANFPNIINYTSDITIQKLAVGNSTNNIGSIDTYYTDLECNSANITAYTDDTGSWTSGTAGANHNAQTIRNVNVGKPVPKIDGSISGSFSGTGYPAVLSNTRDFTLDTNSDGLFVICGYDNSTSTVGVKVYEVNGDLQINLKDSADATNMTFSPPPATSQTRVFSSPYLNDSQLGNYGGSTNIIYFVLFSWVSNGSGGFNYYVELFYYDTSNSTIGSVDNQTINNVPFELNYTGKNNIIYPCNANSMGRTKIYLSPSNSGDIIAEFDLVSLSTTATTDGTAMAYSYDNDIFCIADGKNNQFKTYYGGVELGVPTDTISIGSSTDFIDGDWNSNAKVATDTFYFGDVIDRSTYQYKGHAVNTSADGTIDNITSYTTTDPSNISKTFRKIKATQPNICTWSQGPSLGGKLVRLAHSSSVYRAGEFAEYPSNSNSNEDFVTLTHPTCRDCNGQLGGYDSGIFNGLPSGSGNNNILIVTYNADYKLYSTNYLVTSDEINNSITTYGGHNNYLLPLGTVADASVSSGKSYVYIGVSGSSVDFGSTDGSYIVIKFNGN